MKCAAPSTLPSAGLRARPGGSTGVWCCGTGNGAECRRRTSIRTRVTSGPGHGLRGVRRHSPRPGCPVRRTRLGQRPVAACEGGGGLRHWLAGLKSSPSPRDKTNHKWLPASYTECPYPVGLRGRGGSGDRVEPSEPLRADAAAPYFFLSYAHAPRHGSDETDRDMWVDRLFRDLCDHIFQMTDVPGGAAGFMDRQMRAGEIWTQETALSLARCRVFVPLYSPRYFRSSWCGREWSHFSRRAARHRSGRPGTPSAVVPALWTPVQSHQLPPELRRVHYAHTEMGPRYHTYGLYGLIKLSSFRRDYQRAVMELARRIVDVGDNVLVEPGLRTPLDQMPDAFAPQPRTSARRTLRITVAASSLNRLPEGRSPDYYGGSAVDWNPFHPECPTSLGTLAAEIAERLDYRPEVTAFDDGHSTASEPAALDGPEVMLLDRWVLRDPKHREQLGRFDNSHRPATGLMVPWNDADPDSREAETELSAETEATLPRKIHQGRQISRAAVQGIHDHESFGDLLPHVVQCAAAQYLKNPPVRQPPARGTPRFRVNSFAESAHTDEDSPPAVHSPLAEKDDRDDQR
ncbi:TIR-like protein FxsC [Streptomyces sp. NBC_00620]|uniref:TIR-like protein FxsC n=1 Tax=Streptomyces sp. NBC_00620 TaxID=2903666 RepID=UPI00224EDCF1|nr:TIR-like protein FxsC [Streptomyces sp. NBC_00620]MCX4973360.1 TIR-like protein FxsC [Streptomyces sp. NBC_00620]